MIPLQFVGAASAQRTMILAVVVLLVVYYVLTYIDAFDWNLYLLFAGVVTILATNATGFNVLGFIVASPVFPIIALGLLYLGWKFVQAWRESEKTVVEIAGERVDR